MPYLHDIYLCCLRVDGLSFFCQLPFSLIKLVSDCLLAVLRCYIDIDLPRLYPVVLFSLQLKFSCCKLLFYSNLMECLCQQGRTGIPCNLVVLFERSLIIFFPILFCEYFANCIRPVSAC